MYICSCRGVTEEQLQNVSQNKSKMREALQQLNVGKDCGTCLDFAMAAYLKYKHPPSIMAHPVKKKSS